MNDLELQESLANLTVPELIERITRLNEMYTKHLTLLTQEILVRAMQDEHE